MNLKLRFDTNRGVTLVELMVVIAVIGILAAVTAPSVSNAMRRERQRSVVNNVANQMREARNQAMARGEAVVVRSDYDQTGATVGTMTTFRALLNLPDGSTEDGTRVCVTSAPVDTCPDGSICMADRCWGRPARSCRELSVGQQAAGLLGGYTTRVVATYEPPEGNTGIRFAQHTGADGTSVCFSPDGRAEKVGGGMMAPYNTAAGYSCQNESFNLWVADRNYSPSYTAVLDKMKCDSGPATYEEVGGAVVRVMSNGEISVRSPRR